MRTDDLVLDTADGPMRLYEAIPDAEAAGAVLVVQEAFGLNDHIEDVTRRFADEGFHAVAPAFFHRAGGGTAGYGDMEAVMALYEGLDGEKTLADVDVALAHLRAAGFDDPQIGIVGFCWGGWVTFAVALERALGASVGYYGGGIVSPGRFDGFPPLVDRAEELRTPWLGLFGDQDRGIPVDDVETLRTALGGAGVANSVHRYPDAEHGFHCDARPSYHEASSADAWARTLTWFRTNLDG